MKTILAVQKSEYSRCLLIVLDYNIPIGERIICITRMIEIEREVKDLGDKIQIVITTKNTTNQYVAPAMTEKDIKKVRND